MNAIVYGDFTDPIRAYTVTAAPLPHAVQVVCDDTDKVELICTITGLPDTPRARWEARWVTNMPHWKDWLVGEVVEVYLKTPDGAGVGNRRLRSAGVSHA